MKMEARQRLPGEPTQGADDAQLARLHAIEAGGQREQHSSAEHRWQGAPQSLRHTVDETRCRAFECPGSPAAAERILHPASNTNGKRRQRGRPGPGGGRVTAARASCREGPADFVAGRIRHDELGPCVLTVDDGVLAERCGRSDGLVAIDAVHEPGGLAPHAFGLLVVADAVLDAVAAEDRAGRA